MPLNSLDLALIAAVFAGTFAVMALLMFSFVRVRAQKWVGGAIGRFMQGLSEQAAEEEGAGLASSSTGVLNLGGFKIDVSTIKELLAIAPQALQIAKMFGLTGGGAGGGGKIGL